MTMGSRVAAIEQRNSLCKCTGNAITYSGRKWLRSINMTLLCCLSLSRVQLVEKSREQRAMQKKGGEINRKTVAEVDSWSQQNIRTTPSLIGSYSMTE